MSVMSSVINLTSDSTIAEEPWKKVPYRNKRKRHMVIGTGTGDVSGCVKGVPKFM